MGFITQLFKDEMGNTEFRAKKKDSIEAILARNHSQHKKNKIRQRVSFERVSGWWVKGK